MDRGEQDLVKVTPQQILIAVVWALIAVPVLAKYSAAVLGRLKQKANPQGPESVQTAINDIESVCSDATEKFEETSGGCRNILSRAEGVKPLLSSITIFGFVLIIIYLADFQHIFKETERQYNRDTFIYVCLSTLFAAIFSATKNSGDRALDTVLSRNLTDEWKGWMQIAFLLYHYFAAKEAYNLIRVLIAVYVWLTGFGNFSYFHLKGDFSVSRVLRMLFRLNFLVILVCVITNNEFMLYYICPMHTYWFLAVYSTLAIRRDWNHIPKLMALKLGVFFVCNVIVFELGFGWIIFEVLGAKSPLPLLSYQDGLHEWMFRASLDRWACFFGMICAWAYPWIESTIRRAETLTLAKRAGTIGGTIAVLLLWFRFCLYPLDKTSYNKVHPYTSLIPIACYIYLRNATATLRRTYLWIFAYCGRITLETYILQFHVWLVHDAKMILLYPFVTADYPLVNFVIATGVYIGFSKIIFDHTAEIGDAIFGDRGRTDTKFIWCSRDLMWWIKFVGVVACVGTVSFNGALYLE